MQIIVEVIPGGQRITLDVVSTDKISSVKAKIKEKEGIPIEQQALYSDSRLLLDMEILEHCGVKNDDTLRLVILEGQEQEEEDQGNDNDHRQAPIPAIDISLSLGAELVRNVHHQGPRPVRGRGSGGGRVGGRGGIVGRPPPRLMRPPVRGGRCVVM